MTAAEGASLRVRTMVGASRWCSPDELPRIQVAGGPSAAPWRIVEAVREQLGMDVVLLRILEGDTVEVEELRPHPTAPEPSGRFSGDGLWWQRPGWFERVLALVDAQFGRLGITRVGRPQQMRHWDVSAVLRVPTATHPVWFKAVPAVFGHEGAVAHWVSEAIPQHVPGVVAFGNAWLLTEEMAPERQSPAEHVLKAVARVQLASRGRTEELLELGCPYRGLDTVPDAVAALATRTDLLSPTELSGLSERLPGLKAVVATVADLRVPETLVHGDIQLENARWTGDHWKIIDWTDGSVAHPFVELARPLMSADDATRAEAERQFADTWSAVLPDQTVMGALRTAPVVGSAHQLETYRLMVDSIGAHPELVRLLHLWTSRLVQALDSVEP
ncbi:phosphotransferase [Streptomyces nojiriensis]|uniref:phosphotransferase n=1 Tax=Streptomyces nojiriensis TaxID=66374 RepID=UPI0035DB5F5B